MSCDQDWRRDLSLPFFFQACIGLSLAGLGWAGYDTLAVGLLLCYLSISGLSYIRAFLAAIVFCINKWPHSVGLVLIERAGWDLNLSKEIKVVYVLGLLT